MMAETADSHEARSEQRPSPAKWEERRADLHLVVERGRGEFGQGIRRSLHSTKHRCELDELLELLARLQSRWRRALQRLPRI
jgi:hypothetical protein